MPAALQAEHARDLTQRDLYADPGQETDQHGARQEVCQESQANYACDNQKPRGYEGEHCGQRDILIRAGGREPEQAGGNISLFRSLRTSWPGLKLSTRVISSSTHT